MARKGTGQSTSYAVGRESKSECEGLILHNLMAASAKGNGEHEVEVVVPGNHRHLCLRRQPIRTILLKDNYVGHPIKTLLFKDNYVGHPNQGAGNMYSPKTKGLAQGIQQHGTTFISGGNCLNYT